LGVDLVPFKVCSHDCIYCQLGRTTCKTLKRQEYIHIDEVLAEVEASLGHTQAPDYIGLAGSGEPTLNSRIGDLIRSLKAMTQIPVAVITNGSLLWMPEVREDLMQADLVLPSLDAPDPDTFSRINRPHEDIAFERMVEGIARFTREFSGEVWLEVFMLQNLNDAPSSLERLADLAGSIAPSRIQLNTIARPPAEAFAHGLDKERMNALRFAFQGPVEIISETRKRAASHEGHVSIEDASILALLERRPCTLEDIALGLGLHPMETLKHLDRLMSAGKAGAASFGGKQYFTVKSQET
jgi:wyosine [tRNA(Phe)-imidazoG37] synthetase (radical SAM superfamily)